MRRREQEMTRFGAASIAPFAIAAVALWASPWVIPQYIAQDFHRLAWISAGVLIAYLAGAGTGEQLAPQSNKQASFLPTLLLAAAGLIAILPNGLFFITLDAVYRYVIILGLLLILLQRDLNAVAAGRLPKWYRPLRIRQTFWISVFVVMITVRLFLWGYY